MRFGYLGIPSLARTPGRATTFCGGAENDCFVIAFFAEFDPVEYDDFDDDWTFDIKPLLLVFPRVVVFIIVLIVAFLSIILQEDDDANDDINDDEKRFLELVKVFSRTKKRALSDDALRVQ